MVHPCILPVHIIGLAFLLRDGLATPYARGHLKAMKVLRGHMSALVGHIDRIERVITQELPKIIQANQAFQNAKTNSDRQNARIAHDKALNDAMNDLILDHTELYKQFSDNPQFKKWLADTLFNVAYSNPPGPPAVPTPE